MKHDFPLIANYFGQRLQIDLLSYENESKVANKGYVWVFLALDVYTRYAFAYPQKNKNESSCVDSFKRLLQDLKKLSPTVKIEQIDSDNEAAFRSRTFKKICSDNEIKQNLNEPGDHKALGVVDSFCRTVRQFINRYKVAYNTTNWVDVIPDFIYNYNNSKHSTLKRTPTAAIKLGGLNSYIIKQTMKASQQSYNREKYEVGSRVRLKIKRKLFEKKTQEQFTKTIHTITKIEDGKYFVSDRVSSYSKEELLKVDKAEDRVEIPDEERKEVENEIQERVIDRRISRRIAKEQIERNDKPPLTNEEKTEKYLRRKAPDRGPFLG